MKAAVTLKENYEFRRTYQKGVSAVSPVMVLYCRKNRLGRNRLGLVSSTKLGHAVVRNRCRRRLREVYRLEKPQLKTGYDIILVARSRTATASWPELQKQFRRLCRKVDLMKEPVWSGFFWLWCGSTAGLFLRFGRPAAAIPLPVLNTRWKPLKNTAP